MAVDLKTPLSFSPRQRWRIGLDLAVRTALVLAVVVMVNYLGAQFFNRFRFGDRFYLSSQTRMKLSSRTLSVLHSLTKPVQVTLYYDKSDDLYPTITELLGEYHAANPLISVRTVDYESNPGAAEEVKAHYKLTGPGDKNLVIFDCGGRYKVLSGAALAQYEIAPAPSPKPHELAFRRKLVAFNGELAFTSMLLAVTNPKPFKAYFLQGDGEPALNGTGDAGYYKFAAILAENYIAVQPLELSGAKAIPDDCDLLIIAGPYGQFANAELKKIEQYLDQGGRLWVMLDYMSLQRPTGLGDLLAKWGVNVGNTVVEDPQFSTSSEGQDVVVFHFARHSAVSALIGQKLDLILPRPVTRIKMQNPPAQVTDIAFSSPQAHLAGERVVTQAQYPLMATVEQTAQGVAPARGNLRLLVVGDSFFLDNKFIGLGANRDFVECAANWLLDRPALVQGIGPRPVTEFRLLMTAQKQRRARWLLLGGLPGAIMLLGGLVWLRRRK